MSSDRFLLFSSAFLRALGVGMLGVLFALYLATAGLHLGQIGILVATGLAGGACGTLFVSFWADRFGRKKTLILFSTLTCLGGFGLALFPRFLPLLFFSFLGMVNAMGRERGAFFTLEQAILPHTTLDRHRTQVLAWYNLILDLGMALGSGLGSLPFFLRRSLGLKELSSYRWTILLYGALGIASLILYLGLSRQVELHGPSSWRRISPRSRRIITHLSLLFGLDSIAGGFLPSSLIAYWFFRRFGIGEDMLAPLFFFAHVANAFSYLAAAWIARRVGLVNTMVFTHLPANLCLIAIPFAPSLGLAVFFYLVRESLAEMDVPTRQSYTIAVVAPEERTVAAGVTNLTRLVAWVVGPGLAGWAMKGVSLSLPLFLGGGMKILYDLSLYFSFRKLKPPEEKRGG